MEGIISGGSGSGSSVGGSDIVAVREAREARERRDSRSERQGALQAGCGGVPGSPGGGSSSSTVHHRANSGPTIAISMFHDPEANSGE